MKLRTSQNWWSRHTEPWESERKSKEAKDNLRELTSRAFYKNLSLKRRVLFLLIYSIAFRLWGDVKVNERVIVIIGASLGRVGYESNLNVAYSPEE